MAFGKKVKQYFFQDEFLNLHGTERRKRIEQEVKFIEEKLDQTEEIKSSKMQESAVNHLPKFAQKMRNHFWNIH